MSHIRVSHMRMPIELEHWRSARETRHIRLVSQTCHECKRDSTHPSHPMCSVLYLKHVTRAKIKHVKHVTSLLLQAHSQFPGAVYWRRGLVRLVLHMRPYAIRAPIAYAASLRMRPHRPCGLICGTFLPLMVHMRPCQYLMCRGKSVAAADGAETHTSCPHYYPQT